MSDALPPSVLTTRVMVELTANGNYVIESYRDGQRLRLTLDAGAEWWQIKDELQAMQRRNIDAANRAELRRIDEEKARHRRVYVRTAEDHGIGFAARTIGGEVPHGYGKYLLPEAAPKAKPAPAAAPAPLSTVDDLL